MENNRPLKPFRFGVVAAAARSADDWLARVREVERLGYSTLVMPDVLRFTLASIPALAAAAAATSTLRIGTYVLANDLRNPVMLAKDLATLDFISGSGRRLLGLAAREADIVAFGVAPETTADEYQRKLTWVRDAAGERFADIELNINLMAVGDRVPQFVGRQLGLTAEGLAARGSVAALVGSTEQMCDQLVRRREELGVSYILVADELMHGLAPVVERLHGR